MAHGPIFGYIAITGTILHVVVVGGFFYFAYQINQSLRRIADSLDKPTGIEFLE